MERFKEDRKLDNKREPINDTVMVHLEYQIGWKQIKRTEVVYNRRSGYCLDAKDKSKSSLSLSDIGKIYEGMLNGRVRTWVMACYPDLESTAMVELKKELSKYNKSVMMPTEVYTDCNSEDGITVGLIDAIITQCRLLKGRNLSVHSVREALNDLKQDADLKMLLK